MRGFGALFVTVGTNQYVIGIGPKEAFLNGGGGEPQLRQLVHLDMSLRLVLELPDVEIQLGG